MQNPTKEFLKDDFQEFDTDKRNGISMQRLSNYDLLLSYGLVEYFV